MATYISIETDKKISYQIDGGDKQTMFANIEDDGYPEPTGTITITENGTGIDVKDYAEADVNVPGGGYPEPTGTITITQNGTGIDVKDYAAADVEVPTYPEPTGTITITQNGTGINVKDYAAADVAVPTYPEPTGTKQISITQNGTTTENVKDYASAEITVAVPSGYTINGFLDGSEPYGDVTTTVSSVVNMEGLLGRNSGITIFRAPNLTAIPAQFMRYTAAQKLYLDSLIAVPSNSFANMANLEFVDFGALTSIGGNGAFYDCRKLATMVIRSSEVCTLNSGNRMTNTPIVNGTGTIYVPNSLISSYQAATGWVDCYNAGTQFLAIEGSQYE